MTHGAHVLVVRCFGTGQRLSGKATGKYGQEQTHHENLMENSSSSDHALDHANFVFLGRGTDHPSAFVLAGKTIFDRVGMFQVSQHNKLSRLPG